jgi:hypothetical protein
MVKLNPLEEYDLSEAIWKAAEGIKETRKILASISNRLGLKWKTNDPNHIRNMAGFIADNVGSRSESDQVAKHFTDEHYWKK